MGLRLPMTQAEEIKIQHGHAVQTEVGTQESFNIRPFGEQEAVQVNRQELAQIIEARVEEIIGLVLQEIKRSGYDGLLPAGMVLTGGSSAMPGIRTLANSVLGVPVRIAKPENLVGMVDKLESPAYSTRVGLLRWAFLMSEFIPPGNHKRGSYSRSGSDTQGGGTRMEKIRSWLSRLLP